MPCVLPPYYTRGMTTNQVHTTDLRPGMTVRRADTPPMAIAPEWGNKFRTVATAELVGGWVLVRFTDGTGMDARPLSEWEVSA